MKVFIHGIPDTPNVWNPLLDALDLNTDFIAPALPSLAAPAPEGFGGSPDDFVDWLIGEIEPIAADFGPVDLIGHDWGGIFTVRIACLRPDLVRTWTAANAVPDPKDPWPLIARLWATPVLGEFLMSLSPPSQLERALTRQRLSEGMAAHEAAHWKRESRRAILRLYRTGKHVGAEWDGEIANAPPRGLVIWSGRDPYTGMETAETFTARTGADLKIFENAGHWSIVECAGELAEVLHSHWRRVR
ncbi:MAG: alpha/beta hydrolase [Henriciella sp.]